MPGGHRINGEITVVQFSKKVIGSPGCSKKRILFCDSFKEFGKFQPSGQGPGMFE